eukprot:186890-Amphidinium_carterae.1
MFHQLLQSHLNYVHDKVMEDFEQALQSMQQAQEWELESLHLLYRGKLEAADADKGGDIGACMNPLVHPVLHAAAAPPQQRQSQDQDLMTSMASMIANPADSPRMQPMTSMLSALGDSRPVGPLQKGLISASDLQARLQGLANKASSRETTPRSDDSPVHSPIPTVDPQHRGSLLSLNPGVMQTKFKSNHSEPADNGMQPTRSLQRLPSSPRPGASMARGPDLTGGMMTQIQHAVQQSSEQHRRTSESDEESAEGPAALAAMET